MLKARSRKLSMILVLAMLMTMFAGLGAASAAIVDYSAYGVTTVSTGIGFDKTLGSIMIEIDDAVYLGVYDNYVTLKMPSGVSLKDRLSGDPSVTTDASSTSSGVSVVVKNSSTVDIMIPAGLSGTDIKIPLYFNNVKVQSGSGNLDVMFIPQSGSILPGGSVTIANIVSKGATQAMVTSVKSLGAGGGALDTITIGELSPGTLEEGSIKLELPAGVEWDDPAGTVVVAGGWAFEGKGNSLIGQSDFNVVRDADNYSILYLEILKPLSETNAGRIDIGGKIPAERFLSIDIDEDDAKKGDIVAKISSVSRKMSNDVSEGKNDSVTKQDLVIAQYGDYDATITENEVTQLIAGQDEQELGSFYIEESLAGSLIDGRTLTLQLPSGVKWNTPPSLTAKKGSITLVDTAPIPTSDKVRFKLDGVSENPGKILVEDGEVYVDPGFEGDVELRVTGTAGVEGTVKVAEVVKAVDISASKVPNIIIGEQNVAAGDILIKENVADAIQKGDIVIELAGGYVFYKEPTVEVTEGDLRIDDVDINNDDQLVITIDKESNDASTITISDVYVTGYRYAPTGPVIAKFVAAKGNKDNKEYTGSTALDVLYIAPDKGTSATESKDNKYSEKSVGEVTIANCVTPAEGAGVAEFKIGSNIYYLGGAAKVMDVAPYIKGDRTYVPMRYLGEVLGAEVVWDDAARTVTLTKGDTTVVFTIGSTSYTVNGEAKTADVAPEIANDRTMLPARYVAEAFGAVVGWDAVSQTVVVQIAE